ncbi:MAG: amidase [Actinobacteria bacterium]|nr:amidase [Actinomycetota bacterium]
MPSDDVKALPATASDSAAPWRWSANDVALRIRRKEISAEEVTASLLGRIGEMNPVLNALVDLDENRAIESARERDAAAAERRDLAPLLGVPTATKINTDQAGFATSHGVLAWKDAIRDQDDPPIRNLREAGHVFVGRTNCPAFSYRWFTDNAPYGRTLSPWDADRTPGGSSGGAGSAVASGMLPIAYGNDIGGSVRYPAYACGVAGIRPTVGRIPNFNRVPVGEPFPSLATQAMHVQGPLARNVGDLRLGLDALSGPDLRDAFSFPVERIGAADPSRPLKVGLMRGEAVSRLSPEVADALTFAGRRLEAAGYQVEEVEVEPLIEAFRLWWLLAMEEFRLAMPLVGEVADEEMKAAAAAYYEVAAEWWGQEPSLADYITGYSRRGALICALEEVLADHPLILLPVSARPPFEQGADTKGTEAVRELIGAQWSMMAVPLLGFPALALPTGTASGLPTGVQLLAGRFQEGRLLEAGEVIERAVPALTPITPAFA